MKIGKRLKKSYESFEVNKLFSIEEAVKIVKLNSNTKFDETTVLNVTYQNVKNIGLIKPTLKRYLAGFTKSQFRRIDADEFTVATLLPVARFKKESANKVWSDSRKMV